MSENPVLTLIEKQKWLQPWQEATESFVKNAYGAAGENGQKIKNAMHGVWLGHPLHSAVTDVPVGSWTVGFVLDLLEMNGQEQYAAGADAALVVGLAGATVSAISGLTDWSDTHGKPQRVGMVHALLNGAATVLYTGSWLSRKANKRGLGRALSFLGYGLVGASAYLGGELSYSQKIGVDHAANADEEFPKEFTPACEEASLAEGKPQKANVNGTDIVLLKQNGEIYALGDKCSHLAGPLSEGEVKEGTIQCPWHGSRFCLKDGSVVDGPATNPQPILDVKVEGGQVLVRAHQS
jgi:nitrite reductase/ring-hydroxylating ferredoxin subunit/uncharacterized membrane protein